MGLNELARKAGINNGNLSKMERGLIYPSMETLQKLADALSVAANELLREESNVVEAHEGSQRVRVLDWNQVAHYRDVISQPNTEELKDFLLVDMESIQDVFALKICGDAMSPTFTEGDMIIVDCKVVPQPGDCVVATDPKGEATFKVFRDLGVGDSGIRIFELRPLNDLYAIRRSDKEHLTIVGTMVEHRRRRRTK
jgi:SOS-response transcriptional repressor LexA